MSLEGFEQVNLTEIPGLSYEVFLDDRQRDKIVVLRVAGEYDDVPHASDILALIAAACYRCDPSGFVIDFTDLIYTWGDRFEYFLNHFSAGSELAGHEMRATAVVLGVESRRATYTLIHDFDLPDDWEEVLFSEPGFFRAVTEAVTSVRQTIDDYNAEQDRQRAARRQVSEP